MRVYARFTNLLPRLSYIRTRFRINAEQEYFLERNNHVPNLRSRLIESRIPARPRDRERARAEYHEELPQSFLFKESRTEFIAFEENRYLDLCTTFRIEENYQFIISK